MLVPDRIGKASKLCDILLRDGTLSEVKNHRGATQPVIISRRRWSPPRCVNRPEARTALTARAPGVVRDGVDAKPGHSAISLPSRTLVTPPVRPKPIFVSIRFPLCSHIFGCIQKEFKHRSVGLGHRAPPTREVRTVRQILITKRPPLRCPEPLDLRTPSGRQLQY
jgi:hypothetical protein